MKRLTRISCLFYSIGMAGLGIQQFMYPDFRPVIWPPDWPSWIHSTGIFSYLVGAALIVASILIAFTPKARRISLFLGGFLLILFLVIQVPYVLFVQPYQSYHLGLWINPLKEMALAGGAFIIAGICEEDSLPIRKGVIVGALEKLIPFGRIFFSITISTFGVSHFFYTDFVATLVPNWFPDHLFWTYFGGVALIASGVAIILEIRTARIALLLSLMLFIWFVVLHIPRAVADPRGAQGNEISSVFEALNFSGIALGIYILYQTKYRHLASAHSIGPMRA